MTENNRSAEVTNTDANDLLAVIAGQLAEIAQRLIDGYDIAPAQRLHLEGLSAAALLAGMEAAMLLQFCRDRLPNNTAVYINAAGTGLQFDLWQQRAPVYPTT